MCMFGGIVIPAFLSTLVLLKGMESGRYLVLLPVISAFLTDAGAYFVGVFFGKHKGITRVSPNKSLEGYAGGILFGGLFMLLYGAILHQFGGIEVNFPLMVVYGLVGSAITELGDLSFSLIKRQYGDQGLWKCDPRPWRDAGPLRQHDLCGSGSLADGDSVSSLLGGYGGQRGVLSYEQMYFNIGLHRFHRAAIIGCDCRLWHACGGADCQPERPGAGGAGTPVPAGSWPS